MNYKYFLNLCLILCLFIGCLICMDVGDIFLFFTLVDMSKYNLIAPVAAKLKN